jgi:two-component system sensor histidine kinase FlrB
MAANIAHEIRNPLGGIELFASLLGRDLEDSPDKKRLTHSIIKGVRTINSIISNILLFTKEIQLEIKEHFLSDIVDDVILYLQHIMRDKEIRFINNISEESKIKCDAELFKQVVMNIVHNSVDAVKSGGEIRIESGADGTESWFTITDNGSGIEPSMTGKLFMPFQTTKAKGTGLGLAIVYKIIKAHGGNIEADSDGKTYTTFRVAVPA